MNNQETKKRIKEEFQHLSTIYFNSSYFGPSPLSAKKKVEEALKKELDPSFQNYENWKKIPNKTRELFAKLLNCPAQNITHSTSCCDLIAMIANGLPLSQKDLVVSIDKEYPSNILPWLRLEQNKGIPFKTLSPPSVEFDLDWFKENLPKETKIFNLSHVAFQTGNKIDIISLGKLLKERNIIFILDTTQSLGGLAISQQELQYIDILCCSSYKWLLGPYGHAFGYLSDEMIKIIKPQNGNWYLSNQEHSLLNLTNYTTETLKGAQKFDRGQSPNFLISSCLEGALEFLTSVTLTEIQKHNQSLRDYFLSNYSQSQYRLVTSKNSMGNILSLKLKKNEIDPLMKRLQSNNIDVSIRGEGNLRLSFHLFNTISDVEKLLKTINY